MSDSPAMIGAPRLCPKCGSEIPADAPEGGCPGCLLESALKQQQATRRERLVAIVGELGDYELLEEVGRGGQGVVFRARQKSLNRIVALKVISLGQWASEAHLKRFRREAEAAASLEHPGIVPIHEVGERDGQCYFSMKFVEGGQLDEVVRHAPMSMRQAAELLAKVARTVHYAHGHGILHRDIKPGNILLDKNGEPHLTDFGLARLLDAQSCVTRTIDVLGTPSYMAPEQAAGETTRLSKATDVYGLGAVLYQLLTGQPPFAGGTTYETIRLLRDTEPRQPRLLNPKVDRELSTICLKCLEKDPKRRYSSALALAEDLEHWLKHEPIQAKPSGFFTHSRKWVQRKPAIAALIAALVALTAAMAWNVWKSELFRAAPEKSIAVLPFENLSEDKKNAYFTDGVQDQVITNLGKVSDLKVISQTSVRQYKIGTERNLREIGRQLGVAYVVEGSVQRARDRLRINAQLIDARTDSHVWTETYDRTAADLFAIQSELAQSIVARLKAKLSPQQKAQIEERPTQDLIAFELYLRAKQIVDSYLIADDVRAALLSALQSLDQAIKRDPDFVSAYCYIARANDLLYFFDLDPTPARILIADAAVKAALRLRPESAEAHFAMADFLFRCHRDYDGALKELAIARPGLPNDAAFFILSGYINRRRNNWVQAERDFSTAVALDPRNPNAYNLLADTYNLQRKHFLAAQVYDRVVAAGERTPIVFFRRDSAIFNGTGNSTEIRDVLAKNPDMDVGGGPTPFRVLVALIDRNFAEAERVLAASPREDFQDIDYSFYFPKAWFAAMIARAKGDSARATAAFRECRAILEQRLVIKPEHARTIAVLAQVDAGLGQKELAVREAQHAIDLMPISKDIYDGALVLEGLAQVYVWTGDRDRAIELVQKLVSMPGYTNYALLKLHPLWSPLRGDPRFEKIVASLAPKGN